MSVSNENDILLTKDGYENIEKELEELNMMKLKMSRHNLKRE